jgi:two-component system NtrC family response regulator
MPSKDPIQHILVVDDEKSICRLAQKELASPKREITTAGTAQKALNSVQQQPVDVIVLDIRLPDANGLELMAELREAVPGVEVVLITGYGDIATAVEAMKMGAYDYITKPFNLDRLELVIDKAYQRVCLQRENLYLRHSRSAPLVPKLIGHSPDVERLHYLIDKVAPTHVPVLITGASGAGKNVVAQAIHAQSHRSRQPLIIKNCGALQKDLIRSELFGHRKGAFTGANESQDGLLALAHKGTCFLDEIGELSLEVQGALLRVLETQTYRRVGDKEERKVDVRFIFATNRNLVKEVEVGRFSEALYHRLNVFPIEVTPLRNRKEDIPALVEHFLSNSPVAGGNYRISQKAMQCLLAYDWPGNVRELQNVIERGTILAEDGLISERALPHEFVKASMSSAADDVQSKPFLTLAELEKTHVLRVLKHVKGSRTQAAHILGIGRKTLYRKLQEYD